MDTEESSASSSSPVSTEAERHPRRPPCPRCSSLETRFCYYAGGGTNTRRPKHFCLSCNKFWVEEEEENPIPLRTAANTGGDCCAAAAADAGTRGSTTPPHPKRRRAQPQGAAEQLPCPRCDSTDTRFLKYQSKGRSRPQHFCFRCRRRWLVGGRALKCWRLGDEEVPRARLVERPRCPQCGSSCTLSKGFCDPSRRKRSHKCLRCNRCWTRQVDEWVEAEAVSAEAETAPASRPETHDSPCWEGGDGCSVRRRAPAEHMYSRKEVVTVGCGGAVAAQEIKSTAYPAGASGTTPHLMAAAAQETAITDTGAYASSDLIMAAAAAAATVLGSAEAEDLFWKPGEERELSWEDMERMDYVIGLQLRAPFSGESYLY